MVDSAADKLWIRITMAAPSRDRMVLCTPRADLKGERFSAWEAFI